MATQKDRINTIIALVSSNYAVTHASLNKIKPEFKQVFKVDSINPPQRRNILKILHSTRALDSTLKSILDYHGIRNNSNSIGQYLWKFRRHTSTAIGKLSGAERKNYQVNIADKRNNYLHNADTYPRSESEVYEIISEMQALVLRVTSL